MAILLSNDGKTVETNKATLRRLAADKGDAIYFYRHGGAENVTLNRRHIGRLFESHEAAIKFLANLKGKALPVPIREGEKRTTKKNPAKVHAKARRRKGRK